MEDRESQESTESLGELVCGVANIILRQKFGDIKVFESGLMLQIGDSELYLRQVAQYDVGEGANSTLFSLYEKRIDTDEYRRIEGTPTDILKEKKVSLDTLSTNLTDPSSICDNISSETGSAVVGILSGK